MSSPEGPATQDPPGEEGGTVWDAPNQQVVRADASAPWEEGTGEGEPAGPGGGPDSLDEMTKAQLLEHAQQLGVSPANAAMSKDELRAGIDAKLAETE